MTFFVCILLFQGLNNLAICVLRYRLKFEECGRTAVQQILWLREYPVECADSAYFTIFFSGLSLSVAASLVSHLLSINMRYVPPRTR